MYSVGKQSKVKGLIMSANHNIKVIAEYAIASSMVNDVSVGVVVFANDGEIIRIREVKDPRKIEELRGMYEVEVRDITFYNFGVEIAMTRTKEDC